MIRRILTAPHIWLALALFAVLSFVGSVTPFPVMSAFSRAWQLWIAVAVLVAYGAVGIEALATRRMLQHQALALGICVSFLFSLLTAGTIVFWRLAYPGEQIASNWINIFVVFQGVGGFLHITAPGALNRDTPRWQWIVLGVSCATVVLVAWLVIAYQFGAETAGL